MTDHLSRRRLLQAGGTGTAAAIAGCSRLTGDDPGDGDGSAAVESTVTVAADIPDEEVEDAQATLQERQQEIQEDVEEGEMDEQEAQMAMQNAEMEVQQEYVADAATDLEEVVEDTDGLELSDSEAEMGMLLVEGESGALVELLADGRVYGLMAEAEFEEQLAQRDQMQSGD